jgi:uncharacterized protein YjbI with pentapeptide repeats
MAAGKPGMVDETTPGDEPPAENPSKFFLELALQGKEKWNEWRRDPANKVVRVNFAGIDFSQARKALEKRHMESGSRPANFLGMSFVRARFYGDASFLGRSFQISTDFTNARFYRDASFSLRPLESADFTLARFYRPPALGAEANAAQTNFTGAYIGFVRLVTFNLTFDSHVLDRLRFLRKIAEEARDHDLERDLYIEERKAGPGVYFVQRLEDLKKEPWTNWPRNAARLIAPILWVAVTVLYWALADYGRSFARPIAWWLALSLVIFPWWYGQILAPLKQKAGPNDTSKYEQVVQMVARGNAVPFVGPLTIDAEIKKFLFCPGFGKCVPLPPKSYQWLVIAQNVFSIILVFFIGLALRNYFKIK